MDRDLLSIYYKDISRSKSKPLKAKEEQRLCALIQKGNRKAEHELVKANLRFVVNVARNYQNQGVLLQDLISIGNFGLIKAAKRFDAKKNFKFISYAVWWIRQAILQEISEQSRLVRVPLNRVSKITEMLAIQRKYEQQYHRLPTQDELGVELKMKNKSEDAAMLLRLIRSPLSLDYESDDDLSLGERLCTHEADPYEECETSDLRGIAIGALEHLPEREKEILLKYFGFESGHAMTLDEIGDVFGITRERVRQLRNAGLTRLKNSIKLRHLYTQIN